MQNHAPHTPRLPVLCDSCLAEGAAGEEPFTDLDGLLDFKPVPRQTGRLDAWTPEVQRAFIVALVACGSYNAAALAVGKASNGAAQLRKHEEGAGFLEACKRARAIYRERGGRRRAASVRALAAQDAAWAPHPAPWANAASRRPALPPPPPEPDEEERIEDAEQWLFGIARKYKGMEQERSHNFQRQLLRVSEEARSEHQIIVATAMIAPELDDSKYTIGKASTRDDPSLAFL